MIHDIVLFEPYWVWAVQEFGGQTEGIPCCSRLVYVDAFLAHGHDYDVLFTHAL